MSKVHEDNAGYVGVSYEETQDPYFSYNKLSLPLGESGKTVAIYEQTLVVTQANSKYVVDGVSQASLKLPDASSYTFDLSDSSVATHPFRIKSSAGAPTDLTISYTDAGGQGTYGSSTPSASNFWSGNVTTATSHLRQNGHAWTWTTGIPVSPTDLLEVWAGYLNNTSNHSIDFQITKNGTSTWVTADPAANTTINATGAFVGKTGFDGEWTGVRCNGGSNISVTGILGCFVNKAWVRSSADVSLITSGTQGQAGAFARFNAPGDYKKAHYGYEYYCNSHSGMGSTISLFVDSLRFRAAQPVYKTSDRFGTTIPTASAVTTGIEYAVNNGSNSFDSSSTSLSSIDVTSYTYSSWSGSQDESLVGGNGVNSIHVLRAADGKARTWHVSTDTTDRYLWTSGDGINWASKGGYYDTDGSTQTVISKYLGWAGGSNSSTTSVSASPVPEVQGDPYGAYLSLAVPMHGVHNGMTFPDHADELNPNLSGRTLFNSGGYTRNTHPANYYGTSGYFSSGNDFLTIPCDSSTAFAAGEDFTIEFWMAHPGTFGTGSIHPSILTLAPLQIYRNSNGNIALYDGGDKAAFTYNEDPNWNHFAWVRRNGVVYGYLNGQLKAQTIFNDATGRSSGDGYIGKYPGGAGLGGAYLSDLRIYKGIAKYSEEFVVPSRVDTVDRSGNNNDASNGGATWQTSVKKFYGGAVDFDGTNSVLTVPYSSDFDPGTGDYTVELWALWDAGQIGTLMSWNAGNVSARWDLGCLAAGTLRFFIHNGTLYKTETTVPTGSWLHIAAQRRGNTMELFVNGSPAGTLAISGIWPSASSSGLLIGCRNPSTGNVAHMNGHIQDVRIYKGIAKYSSSFTPPERSVQGTARRYPSGIYVVS